MEWAGGSQPQGTQPSSSAYSRLLYVVGECVTYTSRPRWWGLRWRVRGKLRGRGGWGGGGGGGGSHGN